MQKEDSEKIGPLAYYPVNGTFNLMYYPYYGKKAQVNQYSVQFLSVYLSIHDLHLGLKSGRRDSSWSRKAQGSPLFYL